MRYAPQFGGYCSGGLAAGEYANGNPEAWDIVDAKLYFIKSKEVLTFWQKAPETLIAVTEYNWDTYSDELRDNR